MEESTDATVPQRSSRVSMERRKLLPWHWNIAAKLTIRPCPESWTGKSSRATLPQVALFPQLHWRNTTDQCTHPMDLVQWFLDSGPPTSALCHGYVAKMEGAEHPDVFTAVFEYPGFMASWMLDYANAYQNGRRRRCPCRLDCVVLRKEPNSPVAVAAQAVAGAHLANLALAAGRKVRLDEATYLVR